MPSHYCMAVSRCKLAGLISAVLYVLSIVKDLGPPLGLHINLSKRESFSVHDLNMFPDEIKTSNVPHFDILRAPIGDQCGRFCRLIHLARSIPPLLAVDALSPFDDAVWQCTAEYTAVYTAVDTPDPA